MRYLIACGILPPEIGGPSTVIPAFARDLRRAGHEVEIVTYTPNPDAIEGVRVTAVSRAGSGIARYVRFARAVRKALATADVLMATDVFSVGLPCRIALVGSSVPFYLRLGGEWRWERAVTSGKTREPLRVFWSRAPSVADRIDLARYRWILKRASRVYTTSDWFSDLLRRAFPDVRAAFTAVPNASALPRTAAIESRPHRPLRLLYVGRFTAVKNVPFFANVLLELRKRGVNVACTLIGEGETKAECARLLNGVPGISFPGVIRQADLPSYYGTHDVFILPSLSDICPNAVLDALANGMPCVMTSEHGLPRPLEGVIECDPTDMEPWIRAISGLTEPERYDELLAAVCVPKTASPSLAEAIQRI